MAVETKKGTGRTKRERTPCERVWTTVQKICADLRWGKDICLVRSEVPTLNGTSTMLEATPIRSCWDSRRREDVRPKTSRLPTRRNTLHRNVYLDDEYRFTQPFSSGKGGIRHAVIEYSKVGSSASFPLSRDLSKQEERVIRQKGTLSSFVEVQFQNTRSETGFCVFLTSVRECAYETRPIWWCPKSLRYTASCSLSERRYLIVSSHKSR